MRLLQNPGGTWESWRSGAEILRNPSRSRTPSIRGMFACLFPDETLPLRKRKSAPAGARSFWC